jgi:hypothetical protein
LRSGSWLEAGTASVALALALGVAGAGFGNVA